MNACLQPIEYEKHVVHVLCVWAAYNQLNMKKNMLCTFFVSELH